MKFAQFAFIGMLMVTDQAISKDCSYGPNTCLQGYVWREATKNDLVCVEPDVRKQTAIDNFKAAERRQKNGGAFGRDTCLSGYVWREAFPGDVVCVRPEMREQAALDNSLATKRKACW